MSIIPQIKKKKKEKLNEVFLWSCLSVRVDEKWSGFSIQLTQNSFCKQVSRWLYFFCGRLSDTGQKTRVRELGKIISGGRQKRKGQENAATWQHED